MFTSQIRNNSTHEENSYYKISSINSKRKFGFLSENKISDKPESYLKYFFLC